MRWNTTTINDLCESFKDLWKEFGAKMEKIVQEKKLFHRILKTLRRGIQCEYLLMNEKSIRTQSQINDVEKNTWGRSVDIEGFRSQGSRKK